MCAIARKSNKSARSTVGVWRGNDFDPNQSIAIGFALINSRARTHARTHIHSGNCTTGNRQYMCARASCERGKIARARLPNRKPFDLMIAGQAAAMAAAAAAAAAYLLATTTWLVCAHPRKQKTRAQALFTTTTVVRALARNLPAPDLKLELPAAEHMPRKTTRGICFMRCARRRRRRVF